MLEIIAGVDYDCQIFGEQVLGESMSELCAAYAASKSNDFQFLLQVACLACVAKWMSKYDTSDK